MDPFGAFILYLLALICFVAAACNARVRVNPIGLGLAFAFLVPLIQAGQAAF